MTETTGTQGAPRSLLAFLREGRAGGVAVRQATSGRWNAKRWVALSLLVILPLIAILGVFGGTKAFADDDDDSMQYSFYKVASSTTAFFSAEQEPDSSSFGESWKTIIASPASAGSLLGYADPNFTDVSGWLASKLSGSSDAIGYDTLLVHNDDGSTSSNYQGMVNYAYFGATLQGLGLDSTSTGLSLGFMKWISAGIVMLLFILGGAVDFIFNGVISILGLLNPFKLFYVGVSAIDPNLADGMVGNGSADVGPLSGVADWIGGWYQALTALSWSVMVPLFIAILLFSMFLLKKMDKGGAIKKLVVRLIFIGIGLPLLGTMYTGMISSMADASSTGNSGSARVVMSTYVDFENWATQSRLALPSGATIEWNPKTQSPSGAAQAHVRNTALAINNATHGTNLTAITSSSAYDASWAAQVMSGRGSDQATASDTFGTTVDMLGRFMGGSQMSGASFETISKGNLTQSAYYQGNKATVGKWFTDLTQKASDLNDSTTVSSNPLVSTQSGKGLQVSGTGNAVHKFSTPDYDSCKASGTKIATDDGAPRACNLTPLAMYNYLNTDFGASSMKMYSSSAVASEATRSIHNSVDQVGTGAMSFLYWFNAVVLLGAFVFIGLGYAFALLFGSFRRSFQILSAVPFATLGAIAAIAKVVIYAVALILEVIVTIFVYKIVQEFLTSLPQLIEEPFSQVLNNGKNGAMSGFVAFLVGGWGFAMIVTLLSIVGVLGFTILAMRVRKSIVKAMEEAVTKLVETFLGTQAGMPGGNKLAPALAGGLASGAGAAMANRMMTSGKGPAANAVPTGDKPDGPGAIKTAGGLIPTGPGPSDGDGQLSITADGPGPADGNGDQGNAMGELSASGPDQAAQEVSLGRDVEVNGLSKPGDSDTREPQIEKDALDTASSSVQESQAGYRAADQKRLEAGTEAAAAAGHAALAAGRASAGDAAGAAQSGGKAVEAGGKAVASGQEAKQVEASAGRSALDKPSGKETQRADAAKRISNVGGQVSAAAGAGAANGTTGPGAVAGTPVAGKVQGPKGQTAVQGPRSQQPARPKTPTAQKAPAPGRTQSPTRAPQQKQTAAPTKTVQAPAPKPQQAAPAVTRAPQAKTVTAPPKQQAPRRPGTAPRVAPGKQVRGAQRSEDAGK